MNNTIKNLISAFLRQNSVETSTSFELSDEAFLEMAYRVIFERTTDPEGMASWMSQLQQGLTRLELVKILVNSPEFLMRSMDKLSHAVHNSRLELVQTLLPKAEIILDLGGAHPADVKGALLSFGYPYLPKKLYILDLPPKERMFPVSEGPLYVKYDDYEIEYVYTSMTDLASFKQESFDLVWCGESIEHITLEEAESVFSQVYKLLKPDGKFALDTPNRRATQLQCPNNYIHPEHKIEYHYQELLEIIRKHNFKLVETKGIIDLTESIKSSLFMEEEFIRNTGLNDRPENSYLFYICCMRNDS